jgi:hypothetical protein
VDWRGDGKLDLLVGDMCGGFSAKPNQTAQEKEEERKANDRLPDLRKRWAQTFKRFGEASREPAREAPAARQERLRNLDASREHLRRLKDEIARVQEIQERYQPGRQSHGFVWHFRRAPDVTKGDR